MSMRHRSGVAQAPRAEVRARARSERQRVHTELQTVALQVSGGLEPEDTAEPGAAWRPAPRRDADRARRKGTKRSLRHWKLKAWKRRTAERRARNLASQLTVDQA